MISPMGSEIINAMCKIYYQQHVPSIRHSSPELGVFIFFLQWDWWQHLYSGVNFTDWGRDIYNLAVLFMQNWRQ
jgi:hypothetical protein